MSFAVGAGVNAGVGTAYLFMDPRGFTKGLSQAASEVQKFYKASAAQTNAALRQQEVSSRADAARIANLSRTEGELRRLQEAAIATQGNIARSNQQRAQAEQRYSQAAQRASLASVAAKNQEAAATARLADAEAEVRRIQAARRGPGGRFLPGQRQFIQELAAANLELTAAQDAVAVATRASAAASDLNATAKTAEARAMVAAEVAAEANAASLQRLKTQYAQLDVARRRTFADFGQQTQRALDRLEDAEIAIVRAQQRADRMRAEATALQLAAPGLDDTKREAALRRATELAEDAAFATEEAARRRIRAERNLTAVTVAEERTREAAVLREVEAQKAAQAQILAAQQAARGRLREQIAGAAFKTFLGTGVVIGAATAAFISFETAMTNAFSIMDVGEAETAAMTEQVRELSIALGVSPSVLAEGLYEVAQAGIEGQKAFEVMATAAESSVAGMTDVATAAKPLIAITNAYGEEAGSLESINNKLFAGVTKGVFSFEELAQQMGDNIPLAAALEVNFDELIALYITLTRQSNSLAESTTQLNGIMNSFLKPSEAMRAVLADLNYESGAALIQHVGLAQAIHLVTDAVGHEESALAALFPNIRGLRGVLGATSRESALLAEATRDVADAQKDGGAAAKVLAEQQKTTAFQMKQAREEIRQAAIDLGSGFAPAVAKVVDAIAAMANAFSQLSPQVQTGVSVITIFVFALSGLAVALAKIVSTINGVRDALRVLRTEVNLTKAAFVSLGIGAVLIAIGALAEAFFRSRNAADAQTDALRRQEEQIKATDDAYKSLNDTIQQLLLSNLSKIATVGTRGLEQIQGLTGQVAEDYGQMGAEIDRIEALRRKLLQEDPLRIDPVTVNLYNALGDQVERLEALQVRLGDSNLVAETATQVLNKGLSDQRIDVERLSSQIIFLLQLYEQHELTGAEVVAELQELGANISDFAKDAEDTTAALAELRSQQDALAESSRDLAKATVEEIAGFQDLVPWLEGVQHGMADVDESAAKIMNRIFRQRRGAGLFAGADEDIRRAVELARALERAEAGVERVSEAIEVNSDDMSMWQDRIDLATEVLGLNSESIQEWQEQLDRGEITQDNFNDNIEWLVSSEGMPKLQKLVAEERLTQEQANKIKQDAIWLIQRSSGAILDEEAATALQVSQLANYVRRHDEANEAVKDATDEQREYVSALQSSNAQLALQTLQVLLYLAAIGAIPPSVVTEYIADVSAVDPVVAGLFQDLQLLDKEGKVTIEFNPDTGRFEQVKEEIKGDTIKVPSHFDSPDTSDVDAERQRQETTPVQIPADIVAGHRGPETEAPAAAPKETTTVQAPETAVQMPEKVETIVNFEIDDAGWAVVKKADDLLRNWVPTVDTTFTFIGGATGTGPVEGGGEQSGFGVTINALKNWTTAVTTTFTFAGDTEAMAAFYTELAALPANLDILAATLEDTWVTIATDATRLGESAGLGFKNKLAEGLLAALGSAESIRNSIAATMGFLSSMLFQIGANAGASFVSGLSATLRGGISTAYLIAYAIGAAAEKGIQDALESGSPSRVALREGQNFAQSLVAGMLTEEEAVARQAQSLGAAMNAGIAAGAFGRTTPLATFGQTSAGLLPMNTITPTARTNVIVYQDVTVPAANFPEWIGTMEYVQRMDQGFSTVLATKRGR